MSWLLWPAAAIAMSAEEHIGQRYWFVPHLKPITHRLRFVPYPISSEWLMLWTGDWSSTLTKLSLVPSPGPDRMCDIIIYGTALCSCEYGFRETATAYRDCNSRYCVESQIHMGLCDHHTQCTQPGKTRIVKVLSTQPCIECERSMFAEGSRDY